LFREFFVSPVELFDGSQAIKFQSMRKITSTPFALVSLVFVALLSHRDASAREGGDEGTILCRERYAEQLHGFWLGQSIGNWTGLVTEMVKIGKTHDYDTGRFYTRDDWGGPAEPSIWSSKPVPFSDTIDFVRVGPDGTWGADDDTDIEYLYQHLMHQHRTPLLMAEQIREGWVRHIYPRKEPTPFGEDGSGYYENYLWVSNEHALELMLEQGLLPPDTGKAEHNPHHDMIDAQLTTEIFGLFAPTRPDVALRLAYLPIRTTASGPAAEIAEFYVILHALASVEQPGMTLSERIHWMAAEARKHLNDGEYPARMYDYVLGRHEAGVAWEQVRDELYQRYQMEGQDGYDVGSRGLYCDGCFAAGINFAASLVSLFWGQGDIRETIKIATLAGWDSDNPAATWGGLLGFMLGREGVEQAFGEPFSERFHIHRTRRNFPNDGLDTFSNMARTGVSIIDQVVEELMGGRLDAVTNQWQLPRVD
jgi:hypothetical protein